MRERTTWNRDQVTAATNRTADPYAMNQDHLQQQPKADKYLTGDPSSFAEDVTEPNTWDREYAGGTTDRNEIGMPAFREETFNHAEKSASMDEKTLVKKADLCTTVARMILRGRKFASPEAATEAVESQAVALMYMPSADLINTASRLASQEDFPGGQTWPSNFAAQEEGQQGQGQQQQQQQAQQEGQQQGQGQQQEQQGAMQQQAIQKCMEALQKGDQQGAMAALQQVQQQHQAADYDAKKGPAINPPGYGPENGPQAGGVKSVPGTKGARSAAEEGQQGQGQQQQQQGGQQQQQQQGGQQQQSAEDKALDQMLQQQQQQGGQQQQGQQQGQGQGQGQGGQQAAGYQTADDQLLDDMLMGPQGGGMSEVDIEMEPSAMDMGEVVLSSTDDEVLKSLFANQETEDAEQAQQQQGGGQKQGGMSRTASTNASTRTLGTRPTGGVSRVGGAPSGGTRNDIDTLANMWPSAPDVREAFNIR